MESKYKENNIDLVTQREVGEEIVNNINLKKAPGHLITGEIFKKLQRKAKIKLTHPINAVNLLMKYHVDQYRCFRSFI